MKIANAHLVTSYEYKTKEDSDREEALRLCEMHSIVQANKYEKQIADIPRKQWWKGVKTGVPAGALALAALAAMVKGLTK